MIDTAKLYELTRKIESHKSLINKAKYDIACKENELSNYELELNKLNKKLEQFLKEN